MTTATAVTTAPPRDRAPARQALNILYLPRNLAALVSMASDGDTARYAMMGLYVQRDGTGYRIDATNGRIAAVVRGPSAEPVAPARVTIEDMLRGTPGGGTSALIDRNDWINAFRLAGKGPVALRLGMSSFVFASDAGGMVRGKPMQGRFPPIETIINDLNKRSGIPIMSCYLNPRYVADCMKLAISLGMQKIQFIPGGAGAPLAFVGHNEETQQFLDVMAMPLT